MKKYEKNDIKLSFTTEIWVRFNETDPLGIVWHGNYIKYFEDGREAFGRHYGISYLDVKQNGYATPIVKTICEHKKMIKYGEKITIQTDYIETQAAKMIFRFKIYNQEGDLACLGETTQVFMNLNGELSLYSPEFYQKWKEKYLLK